MIDKNRHVDIMGIINVTDDSFYPDSRCSGVGEVLDRVDGMLRDGASIIDVGACSTRPGASPVGVREEWRRLEPVLGAIRDKYPDIRISVDTYWSDVVRNAYNLIGDILVNDISAGEADPEMLPAVGDMGLSYVAMHKRGMPDNMQMLIDYKDVVQEVCDYFIMFGDKVKKYKIRSWMLDPGFGFAKDLGQNYQLLGGLETLAKLGDRLENMSGVLVGISRKSMVYKPLGLTPEQALYATQVLHLYALQKGADILRVHDVRESVHTLELYRHLP